MERLGFRRTSIAALAVILTSCSGAGIGFQGGVIPEKFKGIKTAQAISPESVQFTWDAFPGASQYRLYSSEANSPIDSPQFNAVVFKPNLATISTSRFSVTAINPSTGAEVGSRTAYIGPITLLPRFDFKNGGSIAAVESPGVDGTRLKVTWPGYATVTYRVYLGERSPDGLVNYNSFVTSTATVSSVSSTTISGLLPGREYCAVVVASYLDNTNDGPDGTPFSTAVAPKLNSWLTGTSGSFGDSVVATSQKCARTSSSLSVDRVKVYSQKAFLTTRPVFYVYDVDHPVENDPAAGFEAAIYQVNDTTGLATYIGKTVGSGQVTSLTDLTPGRYKFYAIVTSKSGSSTGATAKKEIIVGTETGEPEESARKWIYIRGLPDIESPTVTAGFGYYPSKQQAGFGAQHLGSSVAMGDFDCDGKYDLAVGVPDAIETSSRDGRSAKFGKVVIYYDLDDSISPNTGSPRSQVITFDITPSDALGRDLRLGTKLFVGNFNKDNQRTNQNNPSGQSNFQCHDLAIASGYGPLFVLYGKRNVSGLDGGLNYAGTTSYAINPSSSCDTSSNVCSPALYTLKPSDMSTAMAVALSSGNFNGAVNADGQPFEDLVATNGHGGVMVFRGSDNGLIPPVQMPGILTAGCGEKFSTYPFPDGPKKGYPYIPGAVKCWTASTLNANGWGTGGFGTSVGAFANAYYDLNAGGSVAMGTHRIRDVLLIGAPTYVGKSRFPANSTVDVRGRVFVCRPKTDSTAAGAAGMTFANSLTSYDMNEYFKWDCGYNATVTNGSIDPPFDAATGINQAGTPAGRGFGASIVGIRNALLYDVVSLSNNGNSSETSLDLGFPGAVAIGATGTSNIFMYFGSHFPEGGAYGSDTVVANATNRDGLGAARNANFNALVSGTRPTTGNLTLVTEDPCKIVDNAGAVATISFGTRYYREKCDIQKINAPGSADWTTFGFASSLYNLMGSNDPVTTGVDKYSILAAPAPYRDIASSGGTTYTSLGSIQLYFQKTVSKSNGFPVRTTATDNSCDFCRYSNGFTNAGSSSLDFAGTKANNINFGAGGIAAGPTRAGSSSYDPNSDIIVGIPGYVFTSGSTPVIDSGAAQVSFSHGGQFRNYQVGGNSTIASKWNFIYPSFGQEADVRYFQSFSMGDIDQDGLEDIGTRIKLGGDNAVRIMKGKSNSEGAVSFGNAPGEYTDLKIQTDTSAGIRMIPVGKLSGSQFPVYLMVGKKASYLYFAGVGGIVQGQPSAFATGGAPRKLAAITNSASRYLDFGSASLYFDSETDPIDGSDYGNSFAHGDFNGDGYEDLAIGYNNSIDRLEDGANPGTDILPTNMDASNAGRVMIFYGGRDNGFQVQADISGGFPLNTTYFTPYSMTNNVGTGPSDAPCNTLGTCTKIQMLYEGEAVGGTTSEFGKSMTVVPAGSCGGNPVSSLLVQSKLTDGSGNVTSKIFIYKPKCVAGNDYTNLSGLVHDGTSNSTVSSVTTFRRDITPASLSPAITTSTFGNTMISVSGIFGSTATQNTDARHHLVLTDSAKKLLMVFPIVSNSGTSDDCTYTAAGLPTGNCKMTINNDVAQGYQKADYSSSNIFAGSVSFAKGLASVGDVNGDGFSDLALSISSLTKPGTSSTSQGKQGAVFVLFGSPKDRAGLQIYKNSTLIEPARNASCYRAAPLSGSAVNSICNPTLIFAPQADANRDGATEMVYLTRDSKINFGAQNENLSSFLFGVPFRDTREPSAGDRILRGGAFYVIP